MKIYLDFGIILILLSIVSSSILFLNGANINRYDIGFLYGAVLISGIYQLKNGIIIDTKNWKVDGYIKWAYHYQHKKKE